jgi:hypothetical protein
MMIIFSAAGLKILALRKKTLVLTQKLMTVPVNVGRVRAVAKRSEVLRHPERESALSGIGHESGP